MVGVAAGAPPSPSPSSAVEEASHLRRLIEKQPSCLLRVRRDGLLLACNEAGLGLFGKSDLGEILDRPLKQHLAFDEAGAWDTFAERVWTDGAGSLECDMIGEHADRRTVLLQAMALRNHPDALESLLVTVRDISPLKRLEVSLESGRPPQVAEWHEVALSEPETSVRIAALEEQLADAAAAQERLSAAIEGHRSAAEESERSVERLRQQVASAEEQLGAAAADHARLTELLEERQSRYEQVEAEHDALRALHAECAAGEAERQWLRESIERLERSIAEAASRCEQVEAERDALRGLHAECAAGEAERHRLRESIERLERSIAEAASENDQMRKTQAGLRVDLDEWRATVYDLEPLAAAGRIAIESSRTLQEVVSQVDERAALILGASPPDAGYLADLVALRSAARRAASLARQLASLHRGRPA